MSAYTQSIRALGKKFFFSKFTLDPFIEKSTIQKYTWPNKNECKQYPDTLVGLVLPELQKLAQLKKCKF